METLSRDTPLLQWQLLTVGQDNRNLELDLWQDLRALRASRVEDLCGWQIEEPIRVEICLYAPENEKRNDPTRTHILGLPLETILLFLLSGLRFANLWDPAHLAEIKCTRARAEEPRAEIAVYRCGGNS